MSLGILVEIEYEIHIEINARGTDIEWKVED